MAILCLLSLTMASTIAHPNHAYDHTCNFTNTPTSTEFFDGCPHVAAPGETVWFHNHFALLGGDRTVTVTNEFGNVVLAACVEYSPWPQDGVGPLVLTAGIHTITWGVESGPDCVDDVGLVHKESTILTPSSGYNKCGGHGAWGAHVGACLTYYLA